MADTNKLSPATAKSLSDLDSLLDFSEIDSDPERDAILEEIEASGIDDETIETVEPSIVEEEVVEAIADEPQAEVVEEPAAEIDETELEAAIEEPEAAVEEPVEASDAIDDFDFGGEISDADMNALSTDVAKQELYDEQAADEEDESIKAADPADAKKAGKAASAAKPKTPRASTPAIQRDLSALAPELFALEGDKTAADDAVKTATLALRPAQKKIAEKFDNIFISMAAGKTPSTYVMDCFKILDAKQSVTSSELVAALRATVSNKGTVYSEGTARSQVGQVMALFDALKVADRTKDTLAINANSNVATFLRSQVA